MARIVTASNGRYYRRILPYLQSLNERSQLDAVLVCVGDEPFAHGLARVANVRLTREQNYGAPDETESPQHGAWLQAVDGPEDEVIVFTDGDIILQRPFSALELETLAQLPADTILMGYNSGPDETLAVEAARLFPRFPLTSIAAIFGDLARPCYNIGVMAARRSTYRKIYAAYLDNWGMVSDAFGHMARQQWLFVESVHRLGLDIGVTPYSFHANGHYGMPPGCGYRADGLLYAGDDVVAFRHKL